MIDDEIDMGQCKALAGTTGFPATAISSVERNRCLETNAIAGGRVGKFDVSGFDNDKRGTGGAEDQFAIGREADDVGLENGSCKGLRSIDREQRLSRRSACQQQSDIGRQGCVERRE
jgi:hypothetical protein